MWDTKVILTRMKNVNFNSLGIHFKQSIIQKKNKFTARIPIPKSRRQIDIFLMSL